ncbi:MAG: AraC family transcriptional regulator [Clostridia bacterium]|nr:AraC family transcriptional regulator [Clostridia bacterium]
MENLVLRAYFSDNALKKHSHYHDCHQIIFVTKGKAQFCVNEAIYDASAGSVMIFSRYENHAINISSDSYERYVLHIHPSADVRQNKTYAIFSNRPAGFNNLINVSDNLSQFKDLFARITDEFNHADKMSEDMLQLLVDQLLILICRRLPDEILSFDEADFETVADVQRRFEKEYYKRYTLNELAKEYSISSSSLSHQFKRITGASVMGYLQSCRIATAKKYLSKTNMDIGEIVERCGFSDNSNFSRTFKNMCGMSPSQFREKYK